MREVMEDTSERFDFGGVEESLATIFLKGKAIGDQTEATVRLHTSSVAALLCSFTV